MTEKQTTYLIRINESLWARFKARAKQNDTNMRAALEQLVAAYADGMITVEEQVTKTYTVHQHAPKRRAAK